MDIKKQIIVTGGLGFVGHHLIRALVRGGYYPIIIDNLTNGLLSSLKGISRSKYKFIQADIRNYTVLKNKLTGFKPKYLIHLAAVHFIPYCNQHPKEVLDVNVIGTKNILRLLLDFKIENFVHTSSASVYAPNHTKHFENEKLQPIDIYGKSKKLAEKEVLSFMQKNPSIKFNILRLFNVYGSNNLTPHFIPTMLKKIKADDTITVGNIKTVRDYIYVDDVVKAFLLILKKGLNNQTYNIGTGHGISGKQVIKIISKYYNRKVKVKIDGKLLRKKDCPYLLAGVNKIYRDLKFKPRYNFDTGIKKLCKN